MSSTKYSANEIKDFYWEYKFSHGYTKDVFLSKEENKQRLRNKKKDGICFQYYFNNIFPQENKNVKKYGIRFSNDFIKKDENGQKFIYVNDVWEPIMEPYSAQVRIDTPIGIFYEGDPNKISPEVEMLYLSDLKEEKI